MSTLNSVQYQYHHFGSTYLFKVKDEGEISLKILDLSQECLFKRTFSATELPLPDISQRLSKGNFTSVLERLVERQLLPKEHLIPNPKEVTRKTCEEVLDQTIEQYKRKIFVEKREIGGLTCPITLEILREPVVDNHGHSFEKSAIEAYLQRKNECPINRQPIHSLAPNLLVKQTIEECQKQDPIPNFSLFKKENIGFATSNLQMAQSCVEKKEYQEALKFYAKAFEYTRNDEHYAFLPSLFESTKEYEKATLAYLYLAKYQLLADKTSAAIETLEGCQRGESSSIENSLVLIELYYYSAQPKKALALSIQTVKTLSKQNPEQAGDLYKRILRDHPRELSSLQLSLKSLLENPQEKVGEELLQICFGKAKWERFFGEVGVEPPLPKDIAKVLKGPCPYWVGKRVEETHMLILIPQTVNGKPLTLSTLQELAEHPIGGSFATKYGYYSDSVRQKHGDQAVSKSYWALITKDILPDSRDECYAEQQALVKESYVVPRALEIATGIFVHHAQTGERLYSGSPETYTRCQETLNEEYGYRVVVGLFESFGLYVTTYSDDRHHHDIGLSGIRRF